MEGGSRFNIRKVVLSLLFISGVAFHLYSQGTSIGGVINQYVRVIDFPGTDNVTVSDGSVFVPGDTVLMIQMKGVVMNGIQDISYGSYQYAVGSPGAYEFIIIQAVAGNNVTFTANLANTYDVSGLVQLIKVPYYNSAVVNSQLTCQPWDSLTTKTGGVLALIVGGTLTLNADINVSGLGFAGGFPTTGDGICILGNAAILDKSVYDVNYTNAGYKGESLVSRAYLAFDNIPPVYPDFMKGKGNTFTGGGGGNGKYAGGGGGASIGFGGNGGRESNTCSPNYGEGLKGLQILNTPLEGKILLGSGGGSSTHESGSSASAGGKGGGIIIIVCDTLRANGLNSIIANGTNAAAASGNAGAGGGGGAGSIAFYQQGITFHPSSPGLTISAKGGNGGNTNNGGEGGGGGGGLLLTNISFPVKVTPVFSGGLKGTRTTGAPYSTNGLQGEALHNFTPLLNGFLFNKIRSSVSGNNIDSVCSSNRPPKIIGTQPVGGTGSYTYEWQKSYFPTFAVSFPLINDSDPRNYTPKLADTATTSGSVWFRRIVKDAGPPAINDTSKAVRIFIHRKIVNNRVGSPDTICFNTNAPVIQQLMPDLIVPTVFNIEWQDSSSSATWGSTIGSGKNYDPPNLILTTKYRRIVTSGSCADTSHIVEITVLTSINDNKILSADQSVCFGLPFDSLKATTTSTTQALGGGDNSFRFRWEANINGAGWIAAQGNNSTPDYKPLSEILEKAPFNEYYYRRIVFSGTHDACVDTSNKAHLRDYHTISGNTIGPDNQLFCSGSVPVKITGATPNYGDGNFTYTWQSRLTSSTKWTDIPGSVNITDPEYQPPALTDTTFFRRIAYATCVDSANSIQVNIHPAITNNIVSLTSGITDTTICNGQTPVGFMGAATAGAIGSFTYQWLYSANGSTVFVPVQNAIMSDYPDPAALVETTFYRRQVSSGACVDTSTSMITVNVLAPISNNTVSSVQVAVCENTAPDQITGSPPAGGGGGYLYLWEQSTDGSVWSQASGANTSVSYQPPVLSLATWYRRNIISGPADCCSSLSNALLIDINPRPVGPANAGPDKSIFSTGKTFNMEAATPIVTGESGFWTALEPGTASIVDISDNRTEVKHLSTGKNLFVWTITNGLCNIRDSVLIDLLPDFIPQGFSPNNDAINDKFIIKGMNFTEQTVDMTVINGTGTVVFKTTNRNGQEWVDWDGKDNSGIELPEGTYYYMLFYTGPDQPSVKKSGFIVLKRR